MKALLRRPYTDDQKAVRDQGTSGTIATILEQYQMEANYGV